MNELLELIDGLLLVIEGGSKIPMTRKVVLEEDILLKFIADLRQVAHQVNQRSQLESEKLSSEEMAKQRIQDELNLINNGGPNAVSDHFEKEVQATQKALKIKEGANDYADYVLANLQLTLTKMQKNLIHLEKNIESGRDILLKQKKQSFQEGVQK